MSHKVLPSSLHLPELLDAGQIEMEDSDEAVWAIFAQEPPAVLRHVLHEFGERRVCEKLTIVCYRIGPHEVVRASGGEH